MKITVLGGGLSTERQVSLVTATSVCKALREAGHDAVFVDMFMGLENYAGTVEEAFLEPDGLCGEVRIEKEAPDVSVVIASRKLKGMQRLGDRVLDICSASDCVFLGLHGADGEDGKIQAALNLLGVPYTGSDYLSSAMAMDKALSKRCMDSCGVRTPKWKELTFCKADIPDLLGSLELPCVLKIVDGGSSIGVYIPETVEQLEHALNEILRYGNRIIIEKKIVGREFTVPVLGDRWLEPIEIIPPSGGSFDYVSKYQSGKEGATEICPTDLDDDTKEIMGQAAMRIHNALGLSVYSRTDFILDSLGRAWCLEVNTLPGMTPSSLFPKSAAVAGMSYIGLCEEIIRLSMKQRKKERVAEWMNFGM